MGEINMSDADNYDIDFSGVETLTLKYDFLNYSYYRIVAILRDYFHAELNLTRGYKEGRYTPFYKQRYQILDISTKEVIRENIRLNDLRHFFANKGIPLQEEPIPRYKRVRDKGAENFCNLLQSIIEKDM